MKHFAQSKTLWFNACGAALIALEGSFELLQPHMEANIYSSVSMALVVGNAVLRTITTTGVRK